MRAFVCAAVVVVLAASALTGWALGLLAVGVAGLAVIAGLGSPGVAASA